jgi:hypothetical protein
VDEVVATDGCQIAIARENHDMELGICEFYPGCKGNCTPMGGVERVGSDIAGCPRGTPDTGNKNGFFSFPGHLFDSSERTVDNCPVPATGAVDMREAVLAVPVLKAHG